MKINENKEKDKSCRHEKMKNMFETIIKRRIYKKLIEILVDVEKVGKHNSTLC